MSPTNDGVLEFARIGGISLIASFTASLYDRTAFAAIFACAGGQRWRRDSNEMASGKPGAVQSSSSSPRYLIAFAKSLGKTWLGKETAAASSVGFDIDQNPFLPTQPLNRLKIDLKLWRSGSRRDLPGGVGIPT
jgi:hypothetical protein